MRPADRAWLTIAAGVVAWDASCRDGEMLSDASARYTHAHPVLWPLLVIYTSGHLLHIWPANADLFTLLARWLGR